MAGKRNRFTELYDKYFPIVFRAVYTKVADKDDTKDICQEIFTRLYEKFDSVENVRRWLFSALKLVVLEYFRERKKNDNLDIDDVFEDIGLTFVNGFKDARIIINQSFENTENYKDEKDRQIFDLVAICSFTYDQASRQIGITERQVEYRYGRIVERILDDLKKKGIKNIKDLL